MSEPLSQAVRYLFPALFLLVLLRDRTRRSDGEGVELLGFRFWSAALISGAGLVLLYAYGDARTLVEGAVMAVAATVLLPSILLRPGGWARWSLRAGGLLLASQRIASLASFAVEKSSGRVSVLNSDFLLFAAGGVLGILLCVAAFACLSRVAVRVRGLTGTIVTGLSLALLVLEHFAWGYYAMALQGWMTVPEPLFGGLVSLVNHIDVFSYVQMGLGLVFAAAAHMRRKREGDSVRGEMNPAQRRKARWEARREWQLGRAAVFATGLMAAVSFYRESYADRPPRLTHAVQVTAAGGEIAVPVDSFQKEGLRRFVYEDGRGRSIRFIVLMDEMGTLRAGYDACMMCGARGYVKNGKYLICLACGSAIYGPTVGRRGGCNPIPFPYRVEGGRLLIREQDLLQGEGARFFEAAEVG